MFQRIQSLFLLIATAAIVCTFLFPIATAEIGTMQYTYTSYGLFMGSSPVVKVHEGYGFWGGGAALLFLLMALTQFKNRTRQIRICRFAYLFILTQFALCFFTISNGFGTTTAPGEITVHYGPSFFLPLVALIFTFLAERFIRKDEKLVRSADRLR